MPLSNSTPPTIKSVQRGVINFSGGTPTPVAITAVDLTKAVLLHLGTDMPGGAAARVVFSSNVLVTGVCSSGGPTGNLAFEVVEYY